MTKTDFFLTLPSNVKSFKENTLATYGTILPRTLKLPGDWYVGLTEISFTKSWFTMDEPVQINYKHYYGEVMAKILFPPRYFQSVSDMVLALNNTLSSYAKTTGKLLTPKIDVDDSGYVTLSPASLDAMMQGSAKRFKRKDGVQAFNNVFPLLGQELSDILGLPWPLPHSEEMYDDEGFIVRGLRPADIKAGRHSLYVYSDIVEPSIVGDSEVQFLRNITVPEAVRFGQQCDVIFTNPYYFKVHQNEFQRIYIHIKDGSGQTLNFNFGRVITTLHFKKIWTNII